MRRQRTWKEINRIKPLLADVIKDVFDRDGQFISLHEACITTEGAPSGLPQPPGLGDHVADRALRVPVGRANEASIRVP